MDNSNNFIIDLSNFEVQESLINFGSSNYLKIVNLKNGKKYIAEKFRTVLDDFSQQGILRFSQEIYLTSKLKHPSILKFIGFNLTNFKNKPKPVIISEYVSNFTLFQLLYPKDDEYSIDRNIIDLSKSLNSTKKLIIIFGIAYGMSYLHSHDIIHRGLDPLSIFLDDSFYPKISQFENSKELSKSENNSEFLIDGKVVGSIRYLAPEILSDLMYSKASDVYAFAMIFYEVISGHEPFNGHYRFAKLAYLMEEILKNKSRPKFKKEIPMCYRKLISKCWANNPNERPSFDDIVVELKTNLDFITNEINKEEYFNSIKLIENAEISFNPIQKIQQIDELIESISVSFQEVKDDFLSEDLIKSQPFCDLNNFEFLLDDLNNKTEKLIDKKTKLEVDYKFYPKEIDKFLRYEMKSLSKMVNILPKLNHPSICKFFGYSPVDFDNQPKPVIITQKLNELYHLNDTCILCIIYGIASGMAYLHSLNIIHRNLTIDNIKSVNAYFPKIDGFQLAKQINENSIKVNKKIKGTPVYIAPEVYLNKGYCKASDVYAFALIVYELLTGEKPYRKIYLPTDIKKTVAKNKRRPEFVYPVHKYYKELIKSCWAPDPKERPTFDQILLNLRTNPGFITCSINREFFLEYANFLDEFSIKRNEDISTISFDDVFKFRLDTFPDLRPPLHLSNMFDTEMNNLFDGQKWIDFTYLCDTSGEDYEFGYIYSIKKYTYLSENFNEKNIILINQCFFSYLLKNDIINFARELTILSQLNHPSIIEYLGYHFKDDYIYVCYNFRSKRTLAKILESERINKRNLDGNYDSKNHSSSCSLSEGEIDNSKPSITKKNECEEDNENDIHSILNEKENSHSLSDENDNKDIQSLLNEKENVHSSSDKNDNEDIQSLLNEKENIHSSSDKNDNEDIHSILNEKENVHSSSDKNKDENKYWRISSETNLDLCNLFSLEEESDNEQDKLKLDGYLKNHSSFSCSLPEGEIDNLKPSLTEKNEYEKENTFSISGKNNNEDIHSLLNEKENVHSSSDKNENTYSHLSSDGNLDLRKLFLSEEENDNNNQDKTGQYDTLDDTRKLIIIFGVAVGMSYLHSHNILHRDLKPSNIYINELFYPKISGFHISKEIGSTVERNKTIKGTPAYIAPEVYLNKGYSKSSDVYSFALLVYELMTVNKPFNFMSSPKEIKQLVAVEGFRPEFNTPIPKCYRQLIEKCWSQDPALRPTFDEIVSELKTNNEFITDNINKIYYQKYIEYIEKSPQEFMSYKKIQQLEEYFRSNLYKFSDINTNINFKNIYESETKNVLFNYDFIRLDNFEKQKLLLDGVGFKLHLIQDKHTKKQYFAKIYGFHISMIHDDDVKNFCNEVNLFLEHYHPSFLKFIGYSPVNFKNISCPVIVMENASNNSLSRMIEIERKTLSDSIFSDTKRLINIFGIASGFAYLHSKDLITCEFSLSNIFLDDFLFPKIMLFGKMRKLSNNPIKGLSKDERYKIVYFNDKVYKSPEIRYDDGYSSASDVFTFGMIIYSIITNKIPCFQNKEFGVDEYEENLPIIDEKVPKCYKNLIQKCWSFDPTERPTFDEIIYHLKTNQEFITNKIDNEEYQDYIKLIEAYQSNEITQIDDVIKTQNFAFRKVKIDFNKLRDWTRFNFSVNIGSVDLNSFEKSSKIGSGSFGVAYKIINKKTDEMLAAKVSIYEINQCSEDIIRNLSREISIISSLNHPSILRFDGYCPNNFKNKPKPVIITEFAINGSLDKILDMERKGLGNYDWDDTKKLINIYGIASGMAYLHKKNIIHRDLKPGNIFIDEYLYPKIADFGLSKNLSDKNLSDEEFEKSKDPITSGLKGTFAYCSPEILVDQKYKKAGDVYAFAMIVYEIMTNEIPFEGFNQYQLFLEIIHNDYRPKFKFSIPYSYRKLIEKCWAKDTSERPRFDQIVKMLEKDTGFITSNVNKEEFLNYISYINEYQQQSSLIVKEENQPKPDQIVNKASFVSKIIEYEEDNSFQLNKCYIDLSKYEKLNKINKEDTFKICQIREKETGKLLAAQISMIKINQLTKEEDKISKEIEVISQLNHPSILKFIGFSPIDFRKERKPVIIMEFATNGTLGQVLEIERSNKTIPGWNETKKLINIYGIASGMAYLHSNNIIHRCLKPSNIYLDDVLFPKIGDFGLSMRFYNVDLMSHQSISGNKTTPIYSAPEILQHNEFTKMSDVYAFAFVVYEILMKKVPFSDIKNYTKIINEVVVKNQRPKIDGKIHECYRCLIKKCWAQDPTERPTFDEIVYNLRTNHDFITSQIKQEDYFKYIDIIDSQINFEINQKIVESKEDKIITKDMQKSKINELNAIERNIETDFIEENEIDKDLLLINERNYITEIDCDQSLSIDEYISLNKAKELMDYLNSNCDNDFISSIFDQCWKNTKDFYLNLCKEGILINNAVAHHKYAILLILDSNNYVDAKHHLEEAIKQEFLLSYFVYSRLCYLIFNKADEAFISAQEGAKRNEKYSKCLYGYFVSHGIGTKKDFEKGIEIMLNSEAENYYERFSTDFGIYYYNVKRDENKSFYWFEKAFNIKRTKASINNYGACLMKGIGIDKNIKKAEEIFLIGVKQNDNNSMYYLALIRENSEESLKLYKKAAEKGNINAIKFLAKKYSKENDTENTYKYMNSLIESGNYSVPLEYAINCFKGKQFELSFKYFSILANYNHPIAKYYIGLMKYKGLGCIQNRQDSFKIMKWLSNNGIDKATEFIENNFA